MAKKQRRFEQVATATPGANAPAPRYEDKFQQTVGKGIEGFGKKVEGKGRTILYAVGALIVLAIVVFAISRFMGSSNAAGQAALAKAIETSQARVTDTPPVGTTDKTFKSEKERADAAIAEFQAVVDKFGGSVGEKARYFIAVNRLSVDRPAGINELDAISKGSSDSAKLAKFALAQTRFQDGQYDLAAALYQELIAMSDAIFSKDTLNYNLAEVYEKQNKKQEAIDLYYNIAKTSSEAKDKEGNSIPLTETARNAKERLEELDPAKAKEIAEPAPANPFGGGIQ